MTTPTTGPTFRHRSERMLELAVDIADLFALPDEEFVEKVRAYLESRRWRWRWGRPRSPMGLLAFMFGAKVKDVEQVLAYWIDPTIPEELVEPLRMPRTVQGLITELPLGCTLRDARSRTRYAPPNDPISWPDEPLVPDG